MTTSAHARDHAKVFDLVAAEYDRRRPAYPGELVDHACEIAEIASGDQVLEAGCGSGQLTRCLAARGLHITALDPGKNLISLAEENLEGLPGQVEFLNSRFEDASLPHSQFDAVFSASAWHWIDPEVSWREAARVLVPGGTLALIQYFGLREQRSLDDQEALLAALARVEPDIAADWPSYRDLAGTIAGAEERRANVSEVWSWLGSHVVARPEAGRLFCDVQIAAAPIAVEHTADELNALIGTMSLYARLSAAQRQDLEAENVEIHERLGRPIRSSMVAVVVTARRCAGV